jgi:hypothetical protein
MHWDSCLTHISLQLLGRSIRFDKRQNSPLPQLGWWIILPLTLGYYAFIRINELNLVEGLGVQVGNAFVNQYYNVLHQSPQVVHRFYTDASLFTRAEAGPDGAVDTVMTQDV